MRTQSNRPQIASSILSEFPIIFPQFFLGLAIFGLAACNTPPQEAAISSGERTSPPHPTNVTSLEPRMTPPPPSDEKKRVFGGNWTSRDGPACTFTLSFSQAPFGWKIMSSTCSHSELGQARYWRTSAQGIDLLAEDGRLIASYARVDEDTLRPITDSEGFPLLDRAPVY